MCFLRCGEASFLLDIFPKAAYIISEVSFPSDCWVIGTLHYRKMCLTSFLLALLLAFSFAINAIRRSLWTLSLTEISARLLTKSLKAVNSEE